MNSKKYNNIKLAVGIVESILTFMLLFFFLKSGLSYQFEKYLSGYLQNSFLILLIYLLAISIVISILFFPFSLFSGFYIEHKYGLSTQTFIKWVLEGAKGIFISTIIGVPILLFFYYVLNIYAEMWWLPFAIFMFVVSVVLGRIFPTLILPFFYKVIPLEDDELKMRISRLASDSNLKVENVFKFDMSKNTKKANAAFTGLGKSKRVLLGDTLLSNFSYDEIETVLAHEFGHYKRKHISKNILLGTIFSFLSLFLIAFLYHHSLNWFGFNSITQIAAMPLLALWGMLISVLLTPISNGISRKFEYEADAYAVEKTNKPNEFIATLEKLNEQNLGDKEPHPFVEWFFYSHPSIKKRIDAIKLKS